MHILFIAHDSSRTGAPIGLLSLMRWLRAHTEHTFSIVLKTEGGIEDEMRIIGPLYTYKDIIANPGLGSKIMHGVSLIFANTVGVHDILDLLPTRDIPIILHVHELEYMMNFFNGNKLLEKYSFAHILAASNSVRENLIANHQCNPEHISVVYESVAKPDIADMAETKDCIRKELNIAHQDMVVGGSGSVVWRKGPDFFIDIASHIEQMKLPQKVHFIWTGASYDPNYVQQLKYDIKKRNLEQTVRFIGPRMNILDYINALDIFVLPSREDPFPLVTLHAASVSKPIICFEGSGGAQEFVEEAGGYVATYGDTAAIARYIQELIKNPSMRKEVGIAARKLFLEKFELNHTAPRILEIINKTVL